MQSILRRVPIAIAPILGGLAIAAYGLQSWNASRTRRDRRALDGDAGVVSRVNIPVTPDPVPTHIVAVWRSLPTSASAGSSPRISSSAPASGLVDVFLVLYAINVIGISALAYGILVAVQMTTAIVS